MCALTIEAFIKSSVMLPRPLAAALCGFRPSVADQKPSGSRAAMGFRSAAPSTLGLLGLLHAPRVLKLARAIFAKGAQ